LTTRDSTFPAAILLVAALVRFWGIWFGLPHTQARPDESVVAGIAVHFFSGDLNPRFFDYPTLFMYALAALDLAYFAVGRLTGAFLSVPHFLASFESNWSPFYLIGRSLAALLGTATVLVVYRLATRLFGARVGLIAATFLALSFLHARDSHFGVTDIPAAFLICGSLYVLVSAHVDRGPQRFFLAGLLAGLATSTKYNAALLVVPMLASQAIEIVDAKREGRRPFADHRLWLFLAPFAIAFLWGTPYAVLDPDGLLQGFKRVAAHLQEGHGLDLGRGWTYHLAISLRYAVGWPVLVAGLGGMLLIAWKQPRTALLLCSFPLAYYIAAGSGRTLFVRYVIPIVPFLCITAGVAVDSVARRLAAGLARSGEAGSPRTASAIAAVLAAAAVLPSAANLLQFDYLLGRTDNRIIVADWIRERVPQGASLYQSDVSYGKLELDPPGHRSSFEVWAFDEAEGAFVYNGVARGTGPNWIIIQRSPLILYSRVPHAIERLIKSADYARVRSFDAIDPAASGHVFDQHDAFFLPMAGFDGINRPGPNFDVYRRIRPSVQQD
jgi:4-amino-4-deoxy-L-arabinose transferase-like glycosyltransferase